MIIIFDIDKFYNGHMVPPLFTLQIIQEIQSRLHDRFPINNMEYELITLAL
jgi:hypothetical protein